MIDPFTITNFKRNKEELQTFLMFCPAVAGKTAVVIAAALNRFLQKAEGTYGHKSPFDLLKVMIQKKTLKKNIQQARLGKTSLLTKCYTQLVNIDPFNCSIEDLESIHGFGMKSSRFFLLHSRENVKLSVTHALHYLRDQGYSTPKNTPSSSKKYAELEKIMLSLAEKSGMSIANFDLEIWKKYTKTKPN